MSQRTLGLPNLLTELEASSTTPQLETPCTFRTLKEARLLTHFVRTLSSWIDACDKDSTFGTDVVQRALGRPLLAFGILCFTSWAGSTDGDDRRESAQHYYTQAVQLMIPELNRPVDDLSEEVLAAAVLLRLYEERAARADRDLVSVATGPGHRPGTDKRTHLLGSSRLLESIPGVSRGGLAEACAWVVLRQDMMVSLTQSEPLCLPLESLQSSRSFVNEDPQSLANRIVFLCGKILFHAFQPDRRPDNVAWWDEVAAEVAAWYQNKPWHFQPTWVEEQGGGSAFPTLRMAHLGYGTYTASVASPRTIQAGPCQWEGEN